MVANENKIDKSKIVKPTISFSNRAAKELQLIIDNDFTLAGKYFRLVISGKGCEGFTYSAGFTDLTDEDLLIPVKNELNYELFVVVDPFAAFYLNDVTVDFVQDFSNEKEGFVIENRHQKNFQGKFWKNSPEKVPPILNGVSHA